MARPRNEELKEKIVLAAWTQFHERGYGATSYSSIAEACDISRNLAQYHFPKKELLAIAFMERLLSECQEALGYDDESLIGNYRRVFEVGCCYFEFLLQHGYRQFLLDIIASRELTEDILAFNQSWALTHIGALGLDQLSQADVTRSVVMHMGGFYELLYHCLRNDEPFDIGGGLRYVMEDFVLALGTPKETAQNLFAENPDVHETAARISL